MTPLEQALAGRWLRPIDVQAAQLLERIDQGQCPELPLVAAFASWATGQGHTCLPLSVLPGLLTTVNAMSDANPSSFTGMMIGVAATIIVTIILVQIVGCDEKEPKNN